MLRLDPETGDGLPSNPFWDPAHPRSARSRTWALGLRNPYRFSLKPGSGSHNPTDGNPGIFYVGDVGWNSSEDFHVIDRPGLNLGWPIFEGMVPKYPGLVSERGGTEPPLRHRGLHPAVLQLRGSHQAGEQQPRLLPESLQRFGPDPQLLDRRCGTDVALLQVRAHAPPHRLEGRRPGRDLRRERGGHDVPDRGPAAARSRGRSSAGSLRSEGSSIPATTSPPPTRTPISTGTGLARGSRTSSGTRPGCGTVWTGSSPASAWSP